MAGADKYDVAVIGGGPGGYVAGIRLGQHGKKAVVIEREHLGGVCLNWGCIPSKAIIHAGNVRGEVKHFGKVFGNAVPEVNAKELQGWKNGIIDKQRKGIASLLKANNCDHLVGTATLTGAKTLSISGGNGTAREIQVEQLILATGATIIEIPGFKYDDDLVGYARHAVAYDPIPKNLVIIGGGVIGCELGTAYAKLGSKVTIVEMMPQILPGTDKDLLRPVTKTMKSLGIDVLTEAKAKGFKKSAGGAEVEVEIEGKSKTISADRILVSVGFKPNTKGLGLEKASVALDDKGWVKIDAQCRTNVPHIYAIGDITGPPLLAHRASYMGEIAADVIAGKPAAYDAVAMPGGVFTDPEIAMAGLMEAEAKEKGYDVRTGLFPISALGRAGAMNQTEGVVKVVIDAKSDVILGVGITAANACDLIAECCLALEMGALAEDLALTVHVHPTLSEGIMEAAKAARGEAVHIINRKPAAERHAVQKST